MKPETKKKLKQAWENTKVYVGCGCALAAAIGAAIFEHKTHVYIPTESEEHRKKREAAEKKAREERERFLNSLTPNERKIYEKVEDLESENQDLREQLGNVARENDDLQHRVHELDPNY